ncbi:MAG: oxidoreductase [Pseudomonadota bacterium]
MSGSKVVLVTGASSGIGLETALDLLKAGHIVYGGARRLEPMAPIAAAGGNPIQLDVNDDASMVSVVAKIVADEGRIDVLVNNAGYGSYGPVESVPMDEGRRQLEVNVFGLTRMTQLVIPHMRAQKSGRIINISSIGGSIWTPLGAWYHGTKWFVEGFTHALRLELRGTGVDPIIVAPGGIETGFSGTVSAQLEKVPMDAHYQKIADGMAAAEDGIKLSPPSVIAKAIGQAIAAPKPKTIYRAGAFSTLLFSLVRLLPNRWFDRMMMSQFG